jgi:hypothetical protein
LIHRGLPEHTRTNRGDRQQARNNKPLPAGGHVGFACTIKNNFASELNRTNPCACGKQCAHCNERNKDENHHAGIHKLRDYTAYRNAQEKHMKNISRDASAMRFGM